MPENVSNISDCSLLQRDLLAISEWSTTARLQFNSTKCTIFRFCLCDPPFDFPYNINNSAIIATNSRRDLGITMSYALNWSLCCNVLCSRVYRILGLLCHLFSPSCFVQASKLLYLTLVRSQLTFCSPIWWSCFLKDIKSLEWIQSRATKLFLMLVTKTTRTT